MFAQFAQKFGQGLVFPLSVISTAHGLGLVHIDVSGPLFHPAESGHICGLIFIDDFARSTWTHLMTSKSQAFSLVKALVSGGDTIFHTA